MYGTQCIYIYIYGVYIYIQYIYIYTHYIHIYTVYTVYIYISIYTHDIKNMYMCPQTVYMLYWCSHTKLQFGLPPLCCHPFRCFCRCISGSPRPKTHISRSSSGSHPQLRITGHCGTCQTLSILPNISENSEVISSC